MPICLVVLAGLRCGKPVNPAVPRDATNQAAASAVVPLCSVVQNPTLYDGRRVTISGCVTTDGREYVVLSDIAKPCSGGGIVPVDAPALRREQQFDAESGKKVCGTFTGTFRASNALYERVLEVEETSGLITSALTE